MRSLITLRVDDAEAVLDRALDPLPVLSCNALNEMSDWLKSGSCSESGPGRG